MGVSFFSGWSCDEVDTNPNPNPKNFTILQVEKIGRFLVLNVHYPDCNNFEGNKILVYEGFTEEIFMMNAERKGLDPHFFEVGISPIARFRPDEVGWNRAIKLCEVIR